MERQIFCRAEVAAFEAIYDVASQLGAHVFPHLRIREVANRDWIDENDFDFALKGHIDFTVTRGFKPVLAIELDGHYRMSTKAQERDKRKDAVCDSLGIPLVRIDYGDLRPELFKPILKELVEEWLDGRRPPNLTGQHRLQLKSASLMPAGIEICTNDLANGYSESSIKLIVNGENVQVGTARVKTPPDAPVCGRLLAERLALVHASQYLRIIDRASTKNVQAITLQVPCTKCGARNTQPMSMAPPSLNKADNLPRAFS